MRYEPPRNGNRAKGLSLVELLIAIGIMGVTMLLIGGAFPAGVAMSIAVSDEATSQAVFQKALTVIRDNYKISEIPVTGRPDSTHAVIPDDYLSWNGSSYDLPATGLGRDNRVYEIAGQPSNFSWSAMIRLADPTATAGVGPMGNLCQVVVVVSRRPSANATFMPNLQSVTCTDSSDTGRTLT